MTRQQKRIIILLAAANTVFLGVLLVVAATRPGGGSSLGLPTPASAVEMPARLTPTCRQQAAQMLSAAGTTGRAFLTDQTLRFDLVHRVTEDRPAQYAPQHAWTAFDVALALSDAGCEGFRRTDIIIETQDGADRYRVHAAAQVADLRAHHAGELNESALIERVEYRVQRLDDDRL